MRTALLSIGVAAFLIGGGGLAFANDEDDRQERVAAAAVAAADVPFDLEIDADLNAEFPDRTVKAAQAAEIVTDRLGGGVVTEVELEEEDGRPYWEVKGEFRGQEFEAGVDAFDGSLLLAD